MPHNHLTHLTLPRWLVPDHSDMEAENFDDNATTDDNDEPPFRFRFTAINDIPCPSRSMLPHIETVIDILETFKAMDAQNSAVASYAAAWASQDSPPMRYPRPESPGSQMDIVVSPGESWEGALEEQVQAAWNSLVNGKALSDEPKPHHAWIVRFRDRVDKTLITCKSLVNGLSVLADETAPAPTGSWDQADAMQVDDPESSSSRGKKRNFEETTLQSGNIQTATKRRGLLGIKKSSIALE